MTKYVPFLKLKSNEVMAIRELEAGLRQTISPFFDFPYMKNRTEESFITNAGRMIQSIRKNIASISYFYLDNFDVDSSLLIDGGNSYAYLLSACEDLPVVPVISIDRGPEHMQAVCEAKDSGQLESDQIALRFVSGDFASFDVVADDIEECLDDTVRRFSNIDLVLDCRVCLDQDLDSLATNIIQFVQNFAGVYSINRVIVTGSSIPPSIADILSVEDEIELARAELDIFQQVYDGIGDNFDIALGDYCIVSPNYSDVEIIPEVMLNVTAPKIIYTFDRHHYLVRGGAIRTHIRRFRQYNDLAAIVVGKPFYRGANYSFGDRFIEEKSRSVGSQVTPSSILKPTINAHITYMLNGYIPNVLGDV